MLLFTVVDIERFKTLALILDRYDKHTSLEILLLCVMPFQDQPFDRKQTLRGLTGPHFAAHLESMRR